MAMPASLLKHNLARLRAELRLTQADLAAMVNRSPSAIKYIETGDLDLSPKLAALISEVTGAPAEWLLKNDLSEPVPQLAKVSDTYGPEDEEYRRTCDLLKILFHRFFSVLQRLKNGEEKENTIVYVLELVQDIAQGETLGGPFASRSLPLATLDFFVNHPEKLDLDLRGLIDLDLLIHERLKKGYEPARRKSPSSLANVKSEKLRPYLEGSIGWDEFAADLSKAIDKLKQQTSSSSTSSSPLPSSQTQKRKRQKSPSQNPASPSPADRRKSHGSS
jgi:transcriptional regulator with XRE-family HTH domain